ncbi:MAG TPA: SRPBCC family protein [Acidimicrobiales bacterium]
MRGTARREVVVAVDASAAWRVVGRPEVLHHWFPGIVDCRVEGERRTVTLGTGLTLDETILTNDALQLRFQYRITGGVFTEHLASLDVIALTDETCLVTYASDAAPATMAVVLGGAMQGALAELRRQLESGEGPALAAVAAGAAPVASRAGSEEGTR